MSGEDPVRTDIERFLEENGTLSYRFRGISMMPLLRQGRDIFTVVKKGPERCCQYDVVLYRSGLKLLLHRIVEVRPDSYVILGDNNVFKEYGITDSDILGVMTSFNRGGRQISCENGLYRLYSRVWYGLYPVRKPFKLAVRRVKDVLRPVKHAFMRKKPAAGLPEDDNGSVLGKQEDEK